MQWLIDVLREPAAEVVQAALTVLAAALAVRIRGRARRLEPRVGQLEDEVAESRLSASSSNKLPPPQSADQITSVP